jgi:hypothetical protein
VLTFENFWVTVNGLEADPGYCNSNTGYWQLRSAIIG